MEPSISADQSPPHRIRVLIADSLPLFRQGLKTAISGQPDMEVIGEADRGDEAIQKTIALTPDVLICDLNLPGLGGLDVARTVRLQQPNTGIALLAAEEAEEHLFEAVKAGARAYLLKTTRAEDLLADIRRVAAGEHIIDDQLLSSPTIASKVLQQFAALTEETPQEMKPLFAPLSPREIEILEQVSRGNSNKQIARILAISDQTVKNHITSILKKLAVNDRTEAVVFSLRQGWIKVDGIG